MQHRATVGLRHHDDDRQSVFDQRDRAVLELTGSESLRVHVGEFLELERPLERHRIADVATDEQDRAAIGERPGEIADGLHGVKHRADRIDHGFHRTELTSDLIGILCAPGLRQRETNKICRGDLRKEALGRRDADLGPGVRVKHGVGFTRDLRTVGVTDSQDPSLLILGVPDRFQRVGGLARLGDGDDEGLAVEDRIAIAELAGQLDLDGQAGPVLDRVLGEHARVIRGTARHDEHLVDVAQVVVGQALLVEHDATVLQMPEQGVGERAGLLGDLLEHEVVVATLLSGREIPVDVERLAGARVLVEVGDRVALGGDHHDLVLAEFDGVARVLDESGDVGCDEHLVLADTDDQWRRPTRRDDRVGVVGMREDQRERTVESTQRCVCARDEVACGRAGVVLTLDEVHRGLGVGVGGELDALGLELGAQRSVVLDDPVVHDGDLAVGAHMGVRVAIGRLTVRRPARVPHPGGARQGFPTDRGDLLVQVLESACLLLDGRVTVPVENGDTRRVISAVLHSTQRLDNDVEGFAPAHVSDDSTHRCSAYRGFCEQLTSPAARLGAEQSRYRIEALLGHVVELDDRRLADLRLGVGESGVLRVTGEGVQQKSRAHRTYGRMRLTVDRGEPE